MKYATVCSGIGAPEMAWRELGWKSMFFSEIEPFPCAVLKYHYPQIINYGDMTKHKQWPEYALDVLCAGTPCQAFSIAGLRRSMNDDRGNLTIEFIRIINKYNPRYLLWENVPGVLSTYDNAFGCFLSGIVGSDAVLNPPEEFGWSDAGMVIGPRRAAAWRILNAQYFGVPQRRRRIFVVACDRNRGNPAAVLFEQKGLHGDFATSKEAREISTAIPTSGTGFNSPSQREGQETCIKTFDMRGNGDGDIVNSLSGDHAGRPTDYTPVVCVRTANTKSNGCGVSEEISYTIDQSQGQAITCFQNTGQGYWNDKNIAQGLRSGSKSEGEYLNANLITSFNVNARPDEMNTSNNPILTKSQSTGIIINSQIRRLTPKECERLQGFPDDFTKIPWKGKLAEQCPDGPRYKALGNSMAVPVIKWIGQRIQQVEDLKP